MNSVLIAAKTEPTSYNENGAVFDDMASVTGIPYDLTVSRHTAQGVDFKQAQKKLQRSFISEKVVVTKNQQIVQAPKPDVI